MNEPTLKLPRGADDLLRNFPVTEPDFEGQAKAIEARLRGDAKDPGALLPPSAGLSVDELFKVPELAAEPGENAPASTVRAAEPPKAAEPAKAAEPPKSNFAAMARKSVQKGDDEAAHKELLAATAQSRRPSAEMVQRVRAAGRSSATTTPLPASEAGVEDAQRTSGVVARAEVAAPAASAPRPINRGTLIGIAGGVLALAACVALFMKSGESENQTLDAMAAEKASTATVASAAVAPKGPTEAAPSEGVTSPEALAAAAPEAAAREEAKGAPRGASGPGGGLAAAPSKAAPGASPGAKQEAVVLEDDPEPSKPAAPEAKPEVAPEPPLKPAQGNSGNVPLTPSGGAVSTALSSVRGSAQACLAGQTEPVTATITFASDGHVLRVSAGGASATCIQAALSKARIAPFAKDSFTATTTIRPR